MADEYKFDLDNSLQNAPNTDSGLSAINPNTVNEFQLIEQAFYVTDGFKDGKYIIPHGRESFYNSRRQFSCYTNYFKSIIRAMYEPCFAEEIVREHNNDLFEVFEKNCGGENIPLTKFVKVVSKYVKMHDVCFVIMDNKNQESFVSRAEAVQNKAAPFCYIKKAYEVNLDGTHFDDFGKLLSIMFFDHSEKNSAGRNINFYRQWDSEKSSLYKQKEDTESAETFNEKYTLESETYHNLGEIPVLVVYEEVPDSPKNLLPEPSKLSLAKLNLVIFNQDSEKREVARNQGFSILTVPENDGENRDLGIGVNNYIGYPPDSSNKPDFISGDPDLLRALSELRQETMESLIAVAEQSGVQGITKSKDAKSGLAYAFEFFAYESTLQASSKIAEEIETGIIRLFNLWTNEKVEYEIHYPTNFKPNKTAEIHDIYNQTLELMEVPKVFKDKIWIEKFKLLFPDDDEGLAALEKQLEETVEPELPVDKEEIDNGDES